MKLFLPHSALVKILLILCTTYWSTKVLSKSITSDEYIWIESLTINSANLISVSSSESGKVLAAVVVNNDLIGGPVIYLSENGGAEWVKAESPSNQKCNWSGIQLSGSGEYIFLMTSDIGCDGAYISRNLGVSWYSNNDVKNFVRMTSSFSGNYMYAIDSSKVLYYSSDYGYHFSSVSNLIKGNIHDAVISSTGQVVYAIMTVKTSAGERYNTVASSNNFGLDWTYGDKLSDSDHVSIATSSSGQYSALVNNDAIYLSNNYGPTWSISSNFPSVSEYSRLSLLMSSSGQFMVAAVANTIYCSNTYGSDWYKLSVETPMAYSVSMNKDGDMIIIGTNSAVYTGVNDHLAVSTLSSPTLLPTPSFPMLEPSWSPTPSLPMFEPSWSPTPSLPMFEPTWLPTPSFPMFEPSWSPTPS